VTPKKEYAKECPKMAFANRVAYTSKRKSSTIVLTRVDCAKNTKSQIQENAKTSRPTVSFGQIWDFAKRSKTKWKICAERAVAYAKK